MLKRMTILLLAAAATAGMPLFAQMMLQPVAAVNLIRSDMISRDALDAKIEELQASSGQKLEESAVLDIMINDLLVLQGAERDGITLSEKDLNTLVANQKLSVERQLGRSLTEADFASVLLQLYDISLDEFRGKLRQNYIVNTYIRQAKASMINDVPAPTDAEVQSFYKRNAALFLNPEYIRYSHVFISKSGQSAANAKAFAENIYRQIEFGSRTFDEMVVSSSQDEMTKFIGGVVGWLAIDDETQRQVLGDQFFDAVFDLEIGKVSRVIESNTGFHVVKVLERTDPRILGLNDRITPENAMTVRQYINQTLFVEKQQEVLRAAVSELVGELRSEAQITILL